MPVNRKINKKLIDEAVEHFSNGLNTTDVCNCLGITPPAWYGWVNKGAKYDKIYNETGKLPKPSERIFLYAFKAQETGKRKLKEFHLSKIREAKEWTSSAWMLERVFRDEFGKRETTQIDNSKTQILNIVSITNTKEEIINEINSRPQKAIG